MQISALRPTYASSSLVLRNTYQNISTSPHMSTQLRFGEKKWLKPAAILGCLVLGTVVALQNTKQIDTADKWFGEKTPVSSRPNTKTPAASPPNLNTGSQTPTQARSEGFQFTKTSYSAGEDGANVLDRLDADPNSNSPRDIVTGISVQGVRHTFTRNNGNWTGVPDQMPTANYATAGATNGTQNQIFQPILVNQATQNWLAEETKRTQANTYSYQGVEYFRNEYGSWYQTTPGRGVQPVKKNRFSPYRLSGDRFKH